MFDQILCRGFEQIFGPFKGKINKDDKVVFFIAPMNDQATKHTFGAISRVLEGLGSSRSLVGTISTYPGNTPTPW